jgi:hypothetical protein
MNIQRTTRNIVTIESQLRKRFRWKEMIIIERMVHGCFHGTAVTSVLWQTSGRSMLVQPVQHYSDIDAYD